MTQILRLLLLTAAFVALIGPAACAPEVEIRPVNRSEPQTPVPGPTEPPGPAEGQQADQTAIPTLTTLPAEASTATPTIPAKPAPTEETTPMPTPKTPANLPQVDLAIADLARRLNLADPSTIEVISVEFVTWPDGSLGCPQPGMMYTQVLVDGLKIVLKANQLQFNYHSGGGRDPFLCENFSRSEKSTPIDLVPPPTDDTDK